MRIREPVGEPGTGKFEPWTARFHTFLVRIPISNLGLRVGTFILDDDRESTIWMIFAWEADNRGNK
jgi:hypothetical protein